MPRILTIEDDAVTERTVVPTLASTGFTVDVARSGREGIAMVMAGDYDVVALERRLPDLDGLTIVTTMRGVGIETPVIVMSSTTGAEERITHWIATIQYAYTAASSDPRVRRWNPLGFKVLELTSEPEVLPAPAAGNRG